MAKVNFTHKALDDIENILEYHQHYSPSFAKRLADGFFKTAEMLENFPHIGRTLEEIGVKEVREVIYHNYRIVYHIFDEENIDIITIQHSSKDLKRHLPNFN